MKLSKVPAFLILAVLPFFVSCGKDDDSTSSTGGGTPAANGPGTVIVDISNTVDAVNVDETGLTSYTNTSGEAFTVTKVKYYVSGFELFNDNTSHSVPNS